MVESKSIRMQTHIIILPSAALIPISASARTPAHTEQISFRHHCPFAPKQRRSPHHLRSGLGHCYLPHSQGGQRKRIAPEVLYRPAHRTPLRSCSSSLRGKSEWQKRYLQHTLTRYVPSCNSSTFQRWARRGHTCLFHHSFTACPLASWYVGNVCVGATIYSNRPR